MKLNQKGAIDLWVVALLVAVIAIGGVAYWRVSSSDDSNLSSIETNEYEDEIETLPDDLSGIKSIEEIEAVALSGSDGATIVGIELELEDGILVYSVHFADGRVVFYNANTGEQVALNDDNDDDFEDGDQLPTGFVAGISIQEAVSIAKEQRPGSKLKKVELEFEDGVVVYSVRFTDDSRVDVSALDGVIQRLRDEAGVDQIKLDDDYDDDGTKNYQDDDNDNDGVDDSQDDDDDNDEKDDEDDEDDDKDDDNSGSGSGS